MPDLTVPAVLLALVLLILLGQWLVVRRARSMQGQPVPDALIQSCLADGDTLDADQLHAQRHAMNCLVVFDAPRCAACRQMAPVLDALAERYPGRVCVRSVTAHRGLAQTLRIMATPTLLVVRQGQIGAVFVGITAASVLQRHLESAWPDIAPVVAVPDHS